MKIFSCALLMVFAVCFADICDTTSNSGIFKIICSLDTKQKKLEYSFKNISEKAISNDISIKIDDSSSLSIFLKISIIISITVSGGSIIITYRGRKSIKKTQQEIEKDFKDKKNDFEKWFNNTKDNFENIYSKKSEMNDIKKEFEIIQEKLKDIKFNYGQLEEKDKHISEILKIFSAVAGNNNSSRENKPNENKPDNNGD